MRRVFSIAYKGLYTRSLLKKRGGLPSLSTSPGLTQGMGKAEDLYKRLYESEYKETKAEDFNNPRADDDGAQEMINEYRRMRAQNQEVAKRIDETPEYRRYDDELSLEINCLEETFGARVMAGMPVNKDNQLALQAKREEICEYYRIKHAPILTPICEKIHRQVQQEIESGQLVIGEPDETFINSLYERRSAQEEDPRIEAQDVEGLEEGEMDHQQQLISDKWSEDEQDRQREMAFVRTVKKPLQNTPDDR